MGFVMEKGVAKHPFSVRDVEDARDELLGPVSARESRGRAAKRSALKFEKFRGDFTFHEVLPWYRVLAGCNYFHFWRLMRELAKLFSATMKDVLGQPLGQLWMGIVVV